MKTKKFISILLAMLMLTSLLTANVSATQSESLPTVQEGYNRYYFLMPENWYNEHTDTAGIYWWEGTDACESWPGYKAYRADGENIYYYDVPKDVTTIIWNNYLDDNSNMNDPMYGFAKQTINIGSEYYSPGESEHIPEGTTSFDGMIFIIDPNKLGSWYDDTKGYGDWFFYYGNGEYGTTPLPAINEGCNRYFFQMPEEWYNEYTDTAGIYWWESTDACASWPGYKAYRADGENIYYYDVPKDVTTIIWNNYFDVSLEVSEANPHLDLKTVNISLPSSDEFNGKIYIIDPELTTETNNGKKTYSGNWVEYYGYGDFETFGLIGDVNLDGKINVKDATTIQKHLSNITHLFGGPLRLADYNADNEVDVKDATAIQKYIVSNI